MSSVIEHYARHLGPVYTWMAGGVDAAFERGSAELDAIGAMPAGSRAAIDLGAGFGMHAVPLARRGFSVLAIDTSTLLLEELRARKNDLTIQTVQDDLLSFQQHSKGNAELILCMGDTLAHLPDKASILQLISAVADELDAAGRFVVSFRDYSIPLLAEQRFIPVRSDENRVLTCFLEYSDSHVTVYDILHEKDGTRWQQRVSSYRKLRLSPQWVMDSIRSAGLNVHQEPGMAGMIRLIAQR